MSDRKEDIASDKASKSGGTRSKKPAARSAGSRATGAAGADRRTAGERKGTRTTQKAGHAMEPPPIIRPKAKPQRATGEVKAVKGATPTPDPLPVEIPKAEPPKVEETAVAATAVATIAPPARPAEKKTTKPRSFKTAKKATAVPTVDSEATAVPAAVPTAVSTAVPAEGVQDFATVTGGGVTAAGAAQEVRGGPKGVRKIKLSLSYVSPLSVMKMSFLISLAAGVALVVMVFVLWTALDDKHVFLTIDDMISQVAGDDRPKELNVLQYVERGKVMSGAMMLAAIDVVIGTILATLGAVIYNILAALVGGVHVTLKEG